MYSPRTFSETDLRELDRLFERDAFVTLVTVDAAGAPFVSHLPVLYTRTDDRIVIEGHWARPNPQVHHHGHALAIVHGPHAYISPGWYPDKEEASRVPTWNYAVAHLRGALSGFEDEAALADLVDRLSLHNERRVGQEWRFDHTRQSHRLQLRGIVGFRMDVENVALKFKLSQNHPEANVRGAIAGLREQDQHEIAGLMQERLDRRG